MEGCHQDYHSVGQDMGVLCPTSYIEAMHGGLTEAEMDDDSSGLVLEFDADEADMPLAIGIE